MSVMNVRPQLVITFLHWWTLLFFFSPKDIFHYMKSQSLIIKYILLIFTLSVANSFYTCKLKLFNTALYFQFVCSIYVFLSCIKMAHEAKGKKCALLEKLWYCIENSNKHSLLSPLLFNFLIFSIVFSCLHFLYIFPHSVHIFILFHITAFFYYFLFFFHLF